MENTMSSHHPPDGSNGTTKCIFVFFLRKLQNSAKFANLTGFDLNLQIWWLAFWVAFWETFFGGRGKKLHKFAQSCGKPQKISENTTNCREIADIKSAHPSIPSTPSKKNWNPYTSACLLEKWVTFGTIPPQAERRPENGFQPCESRKSSLDPGLRTCPSKSNPGKIGRAGANIGPVFRVGEVGLVGSTPPTHNSTLQRKILT